MTCSSVDTVQVLRGRKETSRAARQGREQNERIVTAVLAWGCLGLKGEDVLSSFPRNRGREEEGEADERE